MADRFLPHGGNKLTEKTVPEVSSAQNGRNFNKFSSSFFRCPGTNRFLPEESPPCVKKQFLPRSRNKPVSSGRIPTLCEEAGSSGVH